MIIKNIEYSNRFVKDLKDLPQAVKILLVEKENIFRNNPLHSSLRLHELHGRLSGLWSISISGTYRIIFEREVNGDIFFISIGRHDIYKNL